MAHKGRGFKNVKECPHGLWMTPCLFVDNHKSYVQNGTKMGTFSLNKNVVYAVCLNKCLLKNIVRHVLNRIPYSRDSLLKSFA